MTTVTKTDFIIMYDIAISSNDLNKVQNRDSDVYEYINNISKQNSNFS